MSKHVSINGVNYRLAEDAEGVHYQLSMQPLRPPNAQVIQGEPGKFQLRPDLLLWSWTDWSEGEGQIKYDPADPGKSFKLEGVNPFRRPGTLMQGYEPVASRHEVGGGGLFSDEVSIVRGPILWAVNHDTAARIHWFASADNEWTAVTYTGVTGTFERQCVAADEDYLYVKERSTSNIWRSTQAIPPSFTKLNDQCGLANDYATQLVALGDYLYVWDLEDGEVYEISKATANTSTPETPLGYTEKHPASSGYEGSQLMAVGENAVYIADYSISEHASIIYEVIPTTAAAAGYVVETGRIPGVRVEAMAYHSGQLYMSVIDRAPASGAFTELGPDRQILYYNPDGTYGTLGSLRGFDSSTAISQYAPVFIGGRLGTLALAAHGDSGLSVFEIDLTTGGIACVGATTYATANAPVSGVFAYDKYIVSDEVGGVWHVEVDKPNDTITGVAISPSNDFSTNGEKVLDAIEIATDTIPSGWTVYVDYSVDGAAWVSAGSITAAAEGGKFAVSTDSATVTFREMRVRLRLDPTTTNPDLVIIRSVNVYARVNRRMKVWDLLLDVQDDRAPRGWGGAKQIDNILNIGNNTVVSFIDRYGSHDAQDAGIEYDVVVDQADFVLSQQGEGIVRVRLLETYGGT